MFEVKAGATKIDNREKKLEGEENVLVEKTEELHEREKDLRQQFMKFHADSDELFHGKAGWEKWHERLKKYFQTIPNRISIIIKLIMINENYHFTLK